MHIPYTPFFPGYSVKVGGYGILHRIFYPSGLSGIRGKPEQALYSKGETLFLGTLLRLFPSVTAGLTVLHLLHGFLVSDISPFLFLSNSKLRIRLSHGAPT